jgi:hypothetical protein
MRRTWTRSPGSSGTRGVGATEQPQVPRGHGVWRVEKAIAGFRRSGSRSDRAPVRSRQLAGEPPVSQGELQEVAHEYRHVHEEHRRAQPRSRARRHLEVRLQQLRRSFERLLAAAPVSEGDRRRWRMQLRAGVAAVPPPADVRPLLFRGRSDSGSELRLAAGADGTVVTWIDGAEVAVLDRADELTGTMPRFVFALDGTAFRETYGASRSSLADLRAAAETGRPPRREHVRALLQDGLIDRTFGLTPRGRRALALDRFPARHAEQGVQPAISVRGPVPPHARDSLARALADVASDAPRPVLGITASLTRHEDPALLRPVVAKATIDLSGRPVRAHVAAPSESEAISLLESRLHRNLRRLAEREIAERHAGHVPEPGEWRHGDIPSPRPSVFARPAGERQLMGRKTYASAPMTPEAAAAEMLLLDHDFHVFADETSGQDALVYSRPDGVLALRRPNGSGSYVEPFVLDADPVPTIGVDDSIERLNLTDDPFVFFVDAVSGRGAVLYRRYDGHYGLVTSNAAT